MYVYLCFVSVCVCVCVCVRALPLAGLALFSLVCLGLVAGLGAPGFFMPPLPPLSMLMPFVSVVYMPMAGSRGERRKYSFQERRA